ncbi:MAG: hypothetical protein ACO3F5_05610, partial [Gemmatimonadaceae bacterium]
MRSRLWTLSAIAFVVAAALWLRAPSLGALAALGVVAVPLLWGAGIPDARRRRGVVRLAAVGFVVVAALHQRALARIGAPEAMARDRTAAAVALRVAVAAEGTRLEALAASAHAVPPPPPAA